jgi:hypothetical protein
MYSFHRFDYFVSLPSRSTCSNLYTARTSKCPGLCYENHESLSPCSAAQLAAPSHACHGQQRCVDASPVHSLPRLDSYLEKRNYTSLLPVVCNMRHGRTLFLPYYSLASTQHSLQSLARFPFWSRTLLCPKRLIWSSHSFIPHILEHEDCCRIVVVVAPRPRRVIACYWCYAGQAVVSNLV